MTAYSPVVDALPDEMRHAIRARIREGADHDDIAREFNVVPGVVKHMAKRSRRADRVRERDAARHERIKSGDGGATA